ncbi:hypothetical protein KQI18_06230 [Clostridioides mangenotii]|uniref:hypothetical protein n=1 Tax=Metaclostridioides mangenotii TaxID=1540 RepID=UPI001C0F406E|nr:hypothetical protein [Clostridioides mangenotii]MBU5307379.1 hypothetical protein [Clostridioides mangenotii]
MINDIAILMILVLVGIGTLISVFLLGHWAGQMRFYKKYNKMVSKNKRLERDNQYLK